MSKELIVATGRHETRVAILEDDQLVEVFHEREKEYSLAGSIHKGRVTRVLPGMQSAFVDIGLERDAFLYVSDFFEDNDEYDAVVSTAEEKVLKLDRAPVAEAAVDAPEGPVAAIPAERPQGQQQPNREARPDRNNERGGRGRRGRRRGGRGPGGIPESKYFTPGADRGPDRTQAAPARESREASPREASSIEESPRETEPEVFERFVLPGESLAKYTGPEREAEPEIPVESAPEPEPEKAQAAPATAPVEEEEDIPQPVLIPTAEAPLEELTAEDEEIILAAAEAVDAIHEETLDEIATGVPVSEIEAEAEAEESGDIFSDIFDDEPEEVAAAAGEPVASADGTPVSAESGSLTATVRDQGHRYPHRVSRRSRRRGGRNRGDRGDNKQDERGPKPATETVVALPEADALFVAPDEPALEEMVTSDVAVEASPATTEGPETPAAREDRRPDRDRGRDRGGDRGGRDRGGRDRGRDGNREASKERETERPERERPVLPSISDLLKEGQEIIVQISKEPLGQKGARITSHIALPGRFVVYMPTVDHAGVSRKIPSDEERQRLKRVLQTHRQGVPGGYICRTAAEGKSEEELKNDMHFLYNLWLDMRQKAEKKPAPVLLHHDLDLVQRILRDQLTTSFKTIWVDNEEHYESILRFVQRFQPALVGRVKLYTRANPIFDEFGITAELDKALRPKVWLKSGGYIVINQTEALVAIDINTGKYVGKSNRLEDTIVKINTDAIKEIVRQVRLRDLGGIIVVDFIDMDERKNRQKVMIALEDAMRVDRAPYKILQFNDFGLVAITRKRVKQSLERTLCAPCSYCEGAGYIKSPQTVITEILQEAQRMHKAVKDQPGNLVLRVNPEVAKVLKSNQNSFLQEVEEILGKSVMVKSDPLLHQTKFDLA